MILFFLSIPVSQISTRTNHIGISSDNPTATIETRYVWTGFWKVTGKPRDLDSTPLVCQAGNGLDDDGRDAAGGVVGEAGEEDEGGADDAHRGVPSYQLLTWLEAETQYISTADGSPKLVSQSWPGHVHEICTPGSGWNGSTQGRGYSHVVLDKVLGITLV